jgi:hypothetical protein
MQDAFRLDRGSEHALLAQLRFALLLLSDDAVELVLSARHQVISPSMTTRSGPSVADWMR